MAARRLGLRRRLATVRSRTVLASCAVVAAALVVAALMTLVVLQRSLVSNLDSTARTRAEDVAALARQGDLPATVAVPGEEDALIQVVDPIGRVIASSANLEGQAAIAAFRPGGSGPEARTLSNLAIGGNEDFRVVALSAPAPNGSVTIYAAATLEQVEESVGDVQEILVVGLPILLALVAATSWIVVGRAFGPVEAIRAEVADISAHDLARRVPVPRTHDEIGRLARTMNEMLDRLQASSDRQRRFVSDASHELQSPLASSRAELEVSLTHPHATDWLRTAAGLLADNERSARLVQNLLFLARADDPAATAPRGPVDLDEVVLAETGRVVTRARVHVDASGVTPVEVRGNADQLARVVSNLLDNAIRHAKTGVSLQLHATGTNATLVVADDGPGIPSADQERIFERFTRLDDSRSRDTGGAGLGLAIAKEIVEAHDGCISAEEARVGSRFRVLLPLS